MITAKINMVYNAILKSICEFQFISYIAIV